MKVNDQTTAKRVSIETVPAGSLFRDEANNWWIKVDPKGLGEAHAQLGNGRLAVRLDNGNLCVHSAGALVYVGDDATLTINRLKA